MTATAPTIYPNVEEIRRVQGLMVICSLLPADGWLRRALQLALSLPADTAAARVQPIEDLHVHAVKEWLETLWLHPDLSDEEKHLVEFQKDSDAMGAALAELQQVEQRTGMKLVAQKA